MRLIATFDNETEGRKFFLFLQSRKIACQSEKGDQGIEIWVKNEEQVALAKEYLDSFQKDELELDPLPPIRPTQQELGHIQGVKNPKPDIPLRIRYRAPFTRLFVFLCGLLYIMGTYQTPVREEKTGYQLSPVLSPLQKTLMYDYPEAFALVAKFNEEFHLESKEELETAPPEAQELLKEIVANPPWIGVYNLLLEKEATGYFSSVQLFSSIREGEVWRVLTPIVLHADILHLIFNMLWLWLLGKMVEENMGSFRYLLFIVVVAAVTNTLQYLASGPLFMGFSGVVSAFAGYIWVRKKVAPWEAYPVDKTTLMFLWIFIFGMLGIQMIAFFMEFFHISSFQMRLANTAHVSGVLLGMVMARVRVFQRKI